jgi:hypothetical protein
VRRGLPAKPADPAAQPTEVELLIQIRDVLASRNGGSGLN